MRTLFIVCVLALPNVLLAQPANPPGQTETASTDLLLGVAREGASYQQEMITKAAEQMSDEDYAFKPVADVRSFAQLIAHVADSNYGFCSTVKGEKSPVTGVEKSKTTRAEIRQALAESFAYCQSVHAGLTDATARTLVRFRGRPRPAIEVLIFRNYHGLLHYGNVITYLRLRGKVPPSTDITTAK